MNTEIKSAGAKASTSAVDAFKLFFAVCIVMIHTSLFSKHGSLAAWTFYHAVLRMGVPFFFVSSGYFLGKKLWRASGRDERNAVCRQYMRKNAVYLAFYGTIGTVLYLMGLLYTRESIKSALLKTAQTVIFYPKGAMWFILACIVAAFLIVKLWDHRKLLYVLVPLLYAFALVCNTYWFTVEHTPFARVVDVYMKYCISARNGLFLGPVMLGSGILAASPSFPLNRWKRRTVVLFAVLAFAAYCAEICLVYGRNTLDDSSLFITSPLAAVALFKLAESIRLPVSRETSVVMRRLSVYLYLLHPIFVSSVGQFMEKGGPLKFALTMAFCLVIWFLTWRSKNAFIRKVLP